MRMCNQCAHYRYMRLRNGKYTDVCDAYDEPMKINNCMRALCCQSFTWKGPEETPIDMLKNYDNIKLP